MSRIKYIYIFLVIFILSHCSTVDQHSTLPTIKPIDLLISSEDMPVDWKSFEVFSDEYDDLCYIDCAMIQFSPVDENKVYAEQSVYIYNTVEEAERKYKVLEGTLQLGTAPSNWSYHSNAANKSDVSCYTNESKSYPSCIWIAQYGKYLVEFYAAILPDRMSLSDLEKIIYHVDSKMKVVANPGQ